MRKDSHLRFVHAAWTLTLKDFPGDAVRALGDLASGGSTEAELVASASAIGDPGDGALASWLTALDRLQKRGAVTCELTDGGAALLRWNPARGWPVSGAGEIDPATRLVMSRHAYIRRSEDRLVLESPLAPFLVELCDPRIVDLVTRFASPNTLGGLSEAELDLPFDAVRKAVALLAEARLLADATDAEDEESRPDGWSFHDLLFHSASAREQPSDQPSLSLPDALAPTLHPHLSGPIQALPKPGVPGLRSERSTLDEVLDRRTSIRDYDDVHPMTVAQLAEFLFRSVRVKSIVPAEARAVYEHSHRVYPSGGALHSLEIYPVVRTCVGLDEGVYHYDPLRHGLIRQEALADRAGRAMKIASAAMGGGPTPQVLLVIGARPSRVFWKYRSIGYALILREVGVVMQTMYLVATSMGLAPCALGSGDGMLLPGTADSDFKGDEVSVGGFSLGSTRSK